MALKVESSDIDESLDNEDCKMKSYIMRQFKKFMKNASAKGFNEFRKQSIPSQFKSQDKGKKEWQSVHCSLKTKMLWVSRL